MMWGSGILSPFLFCLNFGKSAVRVSKLASLLGPIPTGTKRVTRLNWVKNLSISDIPGSTPLISLARE
jgi:hypothetical protein